MAVRANTGITRSSPQWLFVRAGARITHNLALITFGLHAAVIWLAHGCTSDPPNSRRCLFHFLDLSSAVALKPLDLAAK